MNPILNIQNQLLHAFFAALSVAIIVGCKADNTTSPPTTSAISIDKRDRMLSINDLYADYYTSPSNVAERDQNALIDYIAGQNVEAKRSPTGLYYRITEKGNGQYYKVGDRAKVNYKGYLLDGSVFDSSYDRGKPISFKVGEMISGFNEVMYYLQPGGKATVYIPSRLAYGSNGIPDLIPADSPLVFEISCL